MNIQIQVPNEFRTDAWQGMFRRTIVGQGYKVLPMMEHVITELFKTKIAAVRSQTLTLVNVWMPDARLAVGYAGVPAESLIPPNAGIVVTYQLDPRLTKTMPDPQVINGNLKWWRSWGSKKNTEQYISIGIPRTMTTGSDVQGLLFLNALYNSLGVVTRSFMQTFNVPRIEASPISQDTYSLYSQYWGKSFRASARSLPYDRWQFLKQVWTTYSDMLIPKMFYGEFPAYYMEYLHDFVYAPDLNSEVAKYVNTEVVKYCESGLYEFGSSLYNCIPTNSIRLRALLSVLLQLSGNTEQRMKQIRTWYKNLEAVKDVGSVYGTILSLASGSVPTLAKEIISGNYGTQLDELVRYMRLIKTQ